MPDRNEEPALPLRVPAAALSELPHLGAFWPGRRLVPVAGAPVDAAPEGMAAPLAWTPGPFLPPRLGARQVPLLLVVGAGPDPIGAALARPPPAPCLDRARRVMAAMVAGRIGAPPGLEDPGAAALGLAPRGAAVMVAAGGPQAAQAGAAPLLRVADPFGVAPPGGLPRLSPWTVLDAAASLHGASRPLALLALAAGVRVADGPLAGADPVATWAALLAATRAADPFTGEPCEIEHALAILALWREREAEARGIAACLGVHPYKRDRVRALLASAAPAPSFHGRAAPAVAAAKARGGALLAWAASAPPDLPARCQAAGVPLRWLEDGFIRSAGLGAAFRPGASFALDSGGAYYDPAAPSELTRLIEAGGFAPALLARAAALRQAVVARGITKYNLAGAEPAIAAPPGRRVVLVPGQVEDDASVRRGGGAIRRNIDLLRAVRAAEPDAHLLYKPHPDIEAGFRRGRIARGDLAALADGVVERAPIAALLARVDAVHTLTSLTGFEALLRGVAVTCWGMPFYAGWGLTEDRGALPAGAPPRTRRATIDELVAAALILYPRCIDPLTLLPCPPEVLLDRLAQPGLFPPGRLSAIRAAEGWLRRGIARIGGWR
ncbi:capsular polysaccharide export protein, LipB/KpsS family [Falsiroseomonas ponticola]|uniref:capsular polysaccharide export protein, LipB/KpsS family n=1 Tax=Falsiroseomonas ponticola TaxID=2786951 RepID=UPI001932615A|nr:beta-3-deoxy-D-manno-oct-2-ulosonic acid transferase [Roseomonas ponticola]